MQGFFQSLRLFRILIRCFLCSICEKPNRRPQEGVSNDLSSEFRVPYLFIGILQERFEGFLKSSGSVGALLIRTWLGGGGIICNNLNNKNNMIRRSKESYQPFFRPYIASVLAPAGRCLVLFWVVPAVGFRP